ncbi:MAG: MOSC domain-containing protein [Hyphomicrobiaceae bacterium]|nr:MOSC domain-containing protein [Hyphomicrobiaceae bacterium]
METIARGSISFERGLEGDHKGLKFRNRAITILAIEDWRAALAELSDLVDPAALPWTARRANLLVEGVRLPRARGAILSVGPVQLEVTYPTQPCARMDEAHQGLLKALHPDWRGGVTCRVLAGGEVMIGDVVHVVSSPPERALARLP